MTEPNPYEAPQAAEPLSVGTAAKRAGGIGLILLLTPPAVFIAFGGSCAAALLTPDVSSPSIGYAIGFLMFLGIPWGVLVAMTSWAAWRHYRSTESHERRGRITILLLTPIVVAGAIWLGFAATNALMEWGQGELYLLAIATLFATPLLALVAMLYLAWRCDRART